MNKPLILLSAISLCVSAFSYAGERTDDEKNNEAIGFGSGAVAGALVGGPVGGLVGGIIGVLIADDVNDDARIEVAKAQLNEKTQQLDRQKGQLVALQAQYEQVKRDSELQLVSIDKQIERIMQDIESNVQFRTASHVIEEHFKPQLDLVAQGLKNNPQLVVTLSGFADNRGDSTYNQALSEQRVISVKDYLIEKGVNDKQVLTYSFGESQSVTAQASHEDHFFDRRVLVRVAEGQQSMTASN